MSMRLLIIIVSMSILFIIGMVMMKPLLLMIVAIVADVIGLTRMRIAAMIADPAALGVGRRFG